MVIGDQVQIGSTSESEHVLDSTVSPSGLEFETRESYVKFDDIVSSFKLLVIRVTYPIRYHVPDFILPDMRTRENGS